MGDSIYPNKRPSIDTRVKALILLLSQTSFTRIFAFINSVSISTPDVPNWLALSTIFTGSNFEAIVGMAYPALAEKGVTPVFDERVILTLTGSDVVNEMLFAIGIFVEEIS
jgi:hypothetical protein